MTRVYLRFEEEVGKEIIRLQIQLNQGEVLYLASTKQTQLYPLKEKLIRASQEFEDMIKAAQMTPQIAGFPNEEKCYTESSKKVYRFLFANNIEIKCDKCKCTMQFGGYTMSGYFDDRLFCSICNIHQDPLLYIRRHLGDG
jgi:hypothetical protein